jgi:hypothetical protein
MSFSGKWRIIEMERLIESALMPGFEAIVAGSGPSEKPSFLERAKTCWGARQ